MEIVRDMFGCELFVGDSVVFADVRSGDGEPVLDLYEIAEITDGVVKGLLCSGQWIGCLFYLTDTANRAARIRNTYKTAECKATTLLS